MQKVPLPTFSRLQRCRSPQIMRNNAISGRHCINWKFSIFIWPLVSRLGCAEHWDLDFVAWDMGWLACKTRFAASWKFWCLKMAKNIPWHVGFFGLEIGLTRIWVWEFQCEGIADALVALLSCGYTVKTLQRKRFVLHRILSIRNTKLLFLSYKGFPSYYKLKYEENPL